MRLTPLATVTGDSRTMLFNGLATRRANAVSSHQCMFGHLGAAALFIALPAESPPSIVSSRTPYLPGFEKLFTVNNPHRWPLGKAIYRK
jgi:hypothetical protein